jgi:hypothetical protein
VMPSPMSANLNGCSARSMLELCIVRERLDKAHLAGPELMAPRGVWKAGRGMATASPRTARSRAVD